MSTAISINSVPDFIFPEASTATERYALTVFYFYKMA